MAVLHTEHIVGLGNLFLLAELDILRIRPGSLPGFPSSRHHFVSKGRSAETSALESVKVIPERNSAVHTAALPEHSARSLRDNWL